MPFLALLLLACTAPDDDRKLGDRDPDDTGDATGDDTDADTDTDTAPDTDTDDVVAPATEGTLPLTFALDASGAGTDRLDRVELLDAAGTLELRRATHLAVAYQDHDWTAAGYHLYDVLSIAEDGSNLAVTYLYCQGDGLPYAYTESFADPMDWEPATGDCDGAARASEANVSLPALTARPPALDVGVTIEGDDVALDGTSGRIALDGVERELLPFNTVDCTDCPGGPWLEVHSLFAGDGDACFGILYLFPEDPSYVQVEYTLCLPTLARPTAVLDATWSGGLAGPVAPRRAPPMRPRPPMRAPLRR